MKKSFVAKYKFGMTVDYPESKLYHRYFTMSFFIRKGVIGLLKFSEHVLKNTPSSIIWIRLKSFWTSVLVLLIFQSDIIGFSTLSNGECACTIAPLEMTLKLHKHSATLINIVIIKATSNSSMFMTMCHGSYIIQLTKRNRRS